MRDADERDVFERAGVPNYHLGGCVGCDGVPNSGAVLDECGVCGGNGCAGDDPSLWGWCCDCAGVAFGKNTRDLCCVCVDSESYYPNGVKPDAHVRIESLWKQGQRAFGEAQALMEDFKTLPFLKRASTREICTRRRSKRTMMRGRSSKNNERQTRPCVIRRRARNRRCRTRNATRAASAGDN